MQLPILNGNRNGNCSIPIIIMDIHSVPTSLSMYELSLKQY